MGRQEDEKIAEQLKVWRQRQTPPPWRDTVPLASRTRAAKWRKQRSMAVGSNPYYEYARNQNLAVQFGNVVREPVWFGQSGKEQVWFRIQQVDQDQRRRKLFLPVRCRGALAVFVYENVAKGDDVAVVGRLWSASSQKVVSETMSERRQFVYLDAERVSGSWPVVLDYDSRYIRVRLDLWNRISSALPGQLPLVPERRRQELLERWKQIREEAGLPDDGLDDDDLDPDPSARRTPPT